MSNIHRTNCVTTAGGESHAGDKRRVAQVSLGVAASMLMASAASAQTTLPPLAVETKKAPAKAKAKAAPRAKQAPPPVAEAPPAGPIDPSLIPGSYTATTTSSPKQTAPLLDTPQTVTVIPGTIIQERQATNLTEILRTTPGISFEAGENGFGTSAANFQIRGFNASGAIFIDGARDSGSYPRDMFNVDRIEIVKGAASDNGRGVAGGYVNIVTKTPVLENFARAEVGIGFDEYDSEMRRRATFDVNQRFGTTAVRLNGLIEDGGVAGRDMAEANAWGFAPSIAFGLGTDTRLTIAYEHIKRDDRPDWGVPGAAIKGTWGYDVVRNSGFPALRISRDNFYGLASDYDHITGNSVVARIEHDLSDSVTISNQTRWARVDRDAGITIMGGAGTYPTGGAYNPVTGEVSTARQYYDRVNNSLTNQTNLAAKFWAGGFKHSLATGFEITREESDATQWTGGNVGSTSATNPDPYRFPNPPKTYYGANSVKVDTVAAYLYDTIDLTRQLQLTGGLRVERYKVDIDGGPTSTIGSYEDSETSLSGRLGLVYKPVEQASFYAAYGTSVMPQGSLLSNPDISRPDASNQFPGFVPGADPVRIHNYELGVKWDFFGGRLTTAAALFRTEKHKVAYPGSAANVTAGDVDVLGDPVYGKQVVQGLELSVAGNLTERWKVFGGLALIDSERQHGAAVDRSQSAGDYTVGTPGVPGSNVVYTSTDGDELAFTPKFTASLWSTYKFTDRFTAGAGFQYVGESILGRPDDATRIIKNGKYGKLPDYFVVNLMAQYELTDNITLRLNVDNVFDELYARSLNWSAQRADLGPPRTYWLSASFKY